MRIVLFIGIAFEFISTLWTLGVSVENGSLSFDKLDCDGAGLYYDSRAAKYVTENAENIEYVSSEGINNYSVDWPRKVNYFRTGRDDYYQDYYDLQEAIDTAPIVPKFECDDDLPGYSLFLKRCGVNGDLTDGVDSENLLNKSIRVYQLEYDGFKLCEVYYNNNYGTWTSISYYDGAWFKLSRELAIVILIAILGSFIVEVVEFYLEFRNIKKRMFMLIIQSLVPVVAAILLFSAEEFFHTDSNGLRKDTVLCITLIVLVIFTSIVGFICGVKYRNNDRETLRKFSDAFVWFSGTCLECTILIFTEFRSKNTFQFSDISDSVIALLALEIFSLLLVYVGKFCWKKVQESQSPSKSSTTEMV